MPGVKFGDLIEAAREDLAAAARIDADLRAGSVVAAAREVGRIARTLSRYLGDVAPYDVVEALTNPTLDAHARAAVDARQALRTAAGALRRAAGAADGGAVAPTVGGGLTSQDSAPEELAGPDAEPLVVRLRGAGAALAAGRDLMRTHAGVDAEGEWVERSEWAVVIRSPTVTRAVLYEAERWCRELALLAARLSLVSPVDEAIPVAVQHGLASSCHWLLTASGALTAGQRGEPANESGMRLLAAIPVNHVPARRPPADGESFAALAEGLADSAARLRAITRVTPGQGVWSPAMTADSWRWTAGAAMAICQMGLCTLNGLADHPALAGTEPDAWKRLAVAAEGIARTRERWRDVGQAWRSITTEATGLTGPGLADTSDLTIRLGRILHRDPDWTPDRKDSSTPPRQLELAPDAEAFTMVIGAVHYAFDALAQVAAADREAVGLAIRASRLHVPTRLLPATYNVPYRFGPAQPETVAALRHAYRDAWSATRNAVTTLDDLATVIDAPSRVLADARAARRPVEEKASRSERGRQTRAGMAANLEVGESVLDRPRGPVEQAVYRLNTPDPSLLLRAQAVDQAAEEVIRQARLSLQRRRSPKAQVSTQATSDGVQTAGLGFPDRMEPRVSFVTVALTGAPRNVRSPKARGQRRSGR